MKQYLVLIALVSTTVCSAQGSLPPVQRVSEARSAAPPGSPATVAPKQLSAEERALLRRQLYQFRLASKS